MIRHYKGVILAVSLLDCYEPIQRAGRESSLVGVLALARGITRGYSPPFQWRESGVREIVLYGGGERRR